jgi:hypothetical protein
VWSINCALLRIIVPNRVIPSGFLSIFVINKNIDMALQTTGLEFFYLSVDFSENDKILLVEQELGWIDLVALKYSIMVNGVTQLIMMKSDVLDDFETIKACVAYIISPFYLIHNIL